MQFRGTCGRRRSSASRRQVPHGRLLEPRLRRLGVEPLESRRLLSVFLVENLNNSGDGSLRAAIEAANANPGDDTIEFTVAGTVQVQSELPPVNDSTGGLLIDGTTAPGYLPGAEPVLVLDGSLVTEDTTGLTVESDSSEIRGLRIQSFNDSGILNLGTLTLSNSTISGNSARNYGGGIYSYQRTLTVTSSTIEGNSADYDGGGIYGYRGTVTVTRCTIAGNSGRGISNSEGTLTVSHSTIAENLGGGIRSRQGPVTVTYCTIAGNSVSGGFFGGGICSVEGALTVSNSTIAENSAHVDGGGIYSGAGTVTIINCTVAGNSSDYAGGGIRVVGDAATISNSIVAENTAVDALDIYGTLADGSDYNLIGVWSDAFTLPGEHNLSGTLEAPLEPGLSHWTDVGDGVWGYLLMPESPALNAGSNALAIDPDGVPLETDLYGNPRIQDGVVDMGAVEGATEPRPAVTYVVESLDDHIAQDGILTFREAFEAANANRSAGDAAPGSFAAQDRIQFSPGLSGSLLLGGEPLTIYGDLALEGPGSDALTFDAQGASRVFQIRPYVQAAIRGATITGGNADWGGGISSFGTLTLSDSTIAGNSAGYSGGGVRSFYGTLTIIDSNINGNSAQDAGGISADGTLTLTNSIVAGNSARYDGGGIRGRQGTLTVSNSTIAGNSAGSFGGGIYSYGTVTVIDSTIRGNSADDGGGIHNEGALMLTHSIIAGNSADAGGGIYNSGALTLAHSIMAGNSADSSGGAIHSHDTVTVIDSTIEENVAGNDGGGIYQRGSALTITNSTITRNSAGSDGGGICSEEGSTTLTNSTIAENRADYDGGGIYIVRAGLTVSNSTIARNSAGHYEGGIHKSGTLTVTHSIIAQNAAATYPDLRGTLGIRGEYDLIGIWTGLESPPSNSLVGTVQQPLDPRLGPLGDYGGATWTMPLLGDSPAVDAGDPDVVDPPPTDQRGAERIVDGDGDGTARIDMGAFEYVPGEALVFGRHVFYNASSFDGEDPAANEADDAAIAPDKQALLPGQTASFANYTSYSGGINGIMIDVAGLAGTPTFDDFEFRVGNDDEPGGWSAAATPEISVRQGAGIAGSDRITLIWPDNAIQKQWLQVTVLPGGNTGLLEPDVFYFGNAIGECGNSATDAKVNATDMLAARNNQRTFLDPAPINFDFDYNRDARVNATDMLIARNHQTSFLDALNLITVPPGKVLGGGVAAIEEASARDAVFEQAAGAQSTSRQSVSARPAWLYQFDEIGTRKEPSERGEGDGGPLEKVLAAYGL